MPLLLVLGFFGVIAAALASGKSEGGYSVKRLFGLDDVFPENQGGNFSEEYDIFFEAAADKYNIPFALMKAHAIQESSLNPNAFMDENPSGKPERKGWASRGLMQVLWWPGSERFKKYGYPDSSLGANGEKLFEPHVNTEIAAQIIQANLYGCAGNIRDTINMYNTGKKESALKAPGDYVNKVMKYYNILLGKG